MLAGYRAKIRCEALRVKMANLRLNDKIFQKAQSYRLLNGGITFNRLVA